MQLETTLLKLLSRREDWTRLKGAIPRTGLEERTKQIAGRIGEYYTTFPDVQTVEKDAFFTWYFGTVMTKADADTKSAWRDIFDRMNEPLDASLAEGMFDKLLTLSTASKMLDVLNSYNEGEDVDPVVAAKQLLNQHELYRKKTIDIPVVDSNVLDLMDNADNHKGIKWRLQLINEHIRPMAGGDFIGVAARPDRGKTSFLTDNLSHFGPQLEEVFGANRPALWFCNEGSARKIWLRMYQSALNMSMTELSEFRRTVCKGSDVKFLDKFYETIGGKEKVVILDAHKMSNTEVEDIVAKYSPGIVIYDMIDNFNFAGLTLHGGTRTDQMLESMYQWARELAVITDHVGIASSQISGDGEGLSYPAMSMLKDSKTGKQGTFDTLMMLGATNSPGMENFRYIGTPKNKLRVDGSPSNMQLECVFDGMRGRFIVGKPTSYAAHDDEVPAPKKAAKTDPMEDI